MGRKKYLDKINGIELPIRIDSDGSTTFVDPGDDASSGATVPKLFAYRGRNPRRWYLSDLAKSETFLEQPDKAPRTQVHKPSEFVYDERRPQHRRDCINGGSNSTRPCPWVGCTHNRLSDQVLNWDGIRIIELDDSMDSCLLDSIEQLADGASIEHIAKVLNITETEVEEALVSGLRKLKERWVK